MTRPDPVALAALSAADAYARAHRGEPWELHVGPMTAVVVTAAVRAALTPPVVAPAAPAPWLDELHAKLTELGLLADP